MKKTHLLIAVLLVLSGLAAYGQTTSVVLQNREDLWFYFVIDSPELSGLTPSSSSLESKLTDFFTKKSEDFPFTALRPKSSMTLEGLPTGSHFLVGFFVAEEKSEFPVRVLALTVDTRLAQRTYELYSEPALIQLPRGDGRLARFGSLPAVAEAESAGDAAAETAPAAAAGTAETAVADATPAASSEESAAEETPAEETPAEETPAEEAVAQAPAASPAAETRAPEASPVKLATFAPAFEPMSFTREASGVFSVHPISESRFWNRDGTRLAAIDGGRSDGSMVVDIVSASGFSGDVSYFFYLFPSRKEGKDNSYTLELKPVISAEEGIAVLWEAGNPDPIPVGKVSVSGGTCRLSARLSDLPPDVVKALGSNPSADITACFFDPASGTYEEFYYATLSLAEVPDSTR